MRPTVSTGDLALVARPVAPETFAPYGRLLADGGRGYLGKRGRVLATVGTWQPQPLRRTELQRYPEAKRALIPMGRVPMWLVVLAPGEAPSGPPQAFLVPEGVGVVLKEGVWHVGPAPTAPLSICELLETHGPADRLDHRSVQDLCGAPAVRVSVPADPLEAAHAFDLQAPGVVLLDAALQGRIRLGILLLAGVCLDHAVPTLEAELERACEGLRAMWGHATDLREIPGVARGRELYRAWGMDPVQVIPPAEALLAQVLAGHAVAGADPLQQALSLCVLRHPAPLSVLDVAALGSRLVVRIGSDADGRLETGGRPLRLAGRPVLCDGAGRPLAAPFGEAAQARPGPRCGRILVATWFPASAHGPSVEATLDGLARTLQTHLGGGIEGRLVAG